VPPKPLGRRRYLDEKEPMLTELRGGGARVWAPRERL